MVFDPKQLDAFPMQSGVYLMKDKADRVIYVGKAKLLKNRLKQYFSLSDTRTMIPLLIAQIAHIDTIVVFSEKEALLLENTLIKQHKPKFNVLLKDDKTFISLCINVDHPWPMLRLMRYKGSIKDKNLYFGPYTSAIAAREIYELLNKLFLLRQCSDNELKKRTRPCLLYEMNRCLAPCVGLCTKEQYDQQVENVIYFLKGKNQDILPKLYVQMQQASDHLQFEKAASLLKTIRHLEHVLQSPSANYHIKSIDAIGIHRQADETILFLLFLRQGKLTGSMHYAFSNVIEDDDELLASFILQHYQNNKNPPQEILVPIQPSLALTEILKSTCKIQLLFPKKGEKRTLLKLAQENAKSTFKQEKDEKLLKEKMLLDLQDTLQLNRYPKRIECFDTSHLAGSDSVASVIAFTDGIKDTKHTRLYKIKIQHTGDDYTSMQETLFRHLSRAKAADDLPDLIILDGGKGHLTVALEVFKKLDIASIDLIALAKEASRHDKGMSQEKVYLPYNHDPILLNPRSFLLQLLQKIRDESHRKTITFHQKRRKKRLISSTLDNIPGIGPIKKKRLLTHFGSIERIKKASIQDLLQIKGITQSDVDALQKALNL
ncbi:excinuclease ABC subunit UvrC [Candidatus Rhabdochlamydia porcellionis]|jgi:excinuclease ABC subunit C|uniref:UvrABC system protein C n=1 Tax=Candidatus Rhabdochlamydia porcellionis TaxID=225148 RepID=A0ABX8Z0A9_9BACT|nr:excinuclease ABC subunit UvrC [Candidatus Rhabdochlamydia porcellionis]QZA59101.1 UvrABC system protein C [Candidatus Rhabdochlamydia porcellionis]